MIVQYQDKIGSLCLSDYKGVGNQYVSEDKLIVETADKKNKSYLMRMRSGCDGGGKGPLIQEEKSGTLATGNDQTLFVPYNNVCMATQQGGAEIRTDGIAPTLTAAAGMSGNNQPVYCAPTVTGIDGYNATLTGDKSATLGINCGLSTGRNGVCVFQGQASSSAGISASDTIAPTLQAHKQVNAVDCRNATENNIPGALQSAAGHSLNCNNTVRQDFIVRRLTPLECERLQGFPDGWTQIGEVVDYKRHQEFDSNGTLVNERVEAIYEYIDCNGKKRKTTDSARYKALGNSIALPPWFWVLARLSLACGTDATMASLFDGIGGFPLIWQTLNGEGTCL